MLIFSTPLPPLPSEKKYSNFNNFEQCNDDEGIYTKLMVCIIVDDGQQNFEKQRYH